MVEYVDLLLIVFGALLALFIVELRDQYRSWKNDHVIKESIKVITSSAFERIKFELERSDPTYFEEYSKFLFKGWHKLIPEDLHKKFNEFTRLIARRNLNQKGKDVIELVHYSELNKLMKDISNLLKN